MTQEKLLHLEQMHKEIQTVANEAVKMSSIAIQLSRKLAAEINSKTGKIEVSALSEDLQSYLPEYIKISQMDFAEPFHESKPVSVRKAMESLDIIPH